MVFNGVRNSQCYITNFENILHRISGGGKCVLVIISLLGFIFFDSVYIMAIVNYCVQSELIIYALYGLSVKIVQNEVTIDGAIQVSSQVMYLITKLSFL